MRKNLFMLIMLSGWFQLTAQEKLQPKKTSFYAGPQISIAAVDLAKTHSWGMGANVQVVHKVQPKLAITGNARYSYMFGKSHAHHGYEPGGNYSNTSKTYKGMSEVDLTGGVRYFTPGNFAFGADAGFCTGFFDGETSTSANLAVDMLYLFMVGGMETWGSFFVGVCGDPKVQIGLRYSIRIK